MSLPQPPPTPAPVPRPLDYVSLTPRRRWWRLPLALVLFVAVLVAAAAVLGIGFAIAGIALGQRPDWFLDAMTSGEIGPSALLFNNLLLAALIVCTMVSTRLAQGFGMGFTHSVAGRFRWRWFGSVLLVLLPLWLLYIGVPVLEDPPESLEPHPHLAAMLVVVILTTPLQCAGEEYAFRGWILQNVGGLFRHRILAWVVPTLVSAACFAVLHTSLDPWILAQLAIFAIATVIMTWRTGGLEAAIALHLCNNMLVMHYSLIAGGFADSIVDPSTTGTFVDTVYNLIGHGLAVALVWWWARRRGITPTAPSLGRGVPGQVREGIG